MSAHHAPDWVPHREGTGAKHDGILATWLSLISFTFFLATFVAANVYLRACSPDQFNVDFGAQADLPSFTVIALLLAGFLAYFAGTSWKAGKRKAFVGFMVALTLVFFVYTALQMYLIAFTWYLGAGAWTGYIGIYVCQILLAFTIIGFLIANVKYYGDRNEKQMRSLVPATMSIIFYAVVIGLAVLVITNMISIGEFADWCGTKLQQLTN